MPEYQCRARDPVTHPTSSSPAALSRGCRPHGQRLTLFDSKMTDNVWGVAAPVSRNPSFEKCSAMANVRDRNACYDGLRQQLLKPPLRSAIAMSALGQKQTYALQQPMSALHPIATVKADLPETVMSAVPPESRHVRCTSRCRLRARSGHFGQWPPLYSRKRAYLRSGCTAEWICPPLTNGR
jgi:hypothetical protein